MSQHLTRRSLYAAVAVVAASMPALAVGAVPDTELLTLGSDLEAVHTQREAFDRAHPDRDEDPFYERHWQLREDINGIRATTSAGLTIKARAAQMALHYDPENENEGEGSFRDLSCSLIDDFLELSKGGLHA